MHSWIFHAVEECFQILMHPIKSCKRKHAGWLQCLALMPIGKLVCTKRNEHADPSCLPSGRFQHHQVEDRTLAMTADSPLPFLEQVVEAFISLLIFVKEAES